MSVAFLLILLGVYAKAGVAYWICLINVMVSICITIFFALPKKENMI